MEQAGDSLAITRAYLDSIFIEMRHLDAVKPNTTLELFGKRFSTPVMTAALSHLDNARPHGMTRIAEGAKAAGAVMWCGMGDEQELREITGAGAPTIKIIKPYEDRREVYDRIRQARECGVLAVGMDIDHQFGADGEYDLVLGQRMAPVTTRELQDFVKAAEGMPFVVKGVLSAQDADKCARVGAAGVVVSHHNGRIPYSVPPLMVLPAVREAVGRELRVFADCGFRSGADVFKALALGADAVCVGVPLIAPMAEKGAEGAADVLRSMTAELRGIMARTCTPDIRHADRSLLHRMDGSTL